MDQTPQPEDAAESAREERRADVQRRIDEVAGVLAETLLGMWRAKHRAERRGEPWPPPEPPKPEPTRRSVLSDRPKALRRAFRELAPGDEPVANVLLQTTWYPVLELWLEPAGGKRTRAVLEYGGVVMGVVVLDECSRCTNHVSRVGSTPATLPACPPRLRRRRTPRAACSFGGRDVTSSRRYAPRRSGTSITPTSASS